MKLHLTYADGDDAPPTLTHAPEHGHSMSGGHKRLLWRAGHKGGDEGGEGAAGRSDEGQHLHTVGDRHHALPVSHLPGRQRTGRPSVTCQACSAQAARQTDGGQAGWQGAPPTAHRQSACGAGTITTTASDTVTYGHTYIVNGPGHRHYALLLPRQLHAAQHGLR